MPCSLCEGKLLLKLWLIIAVMLITEAVVKLMPDKSRSGLNGIRTHDLCDTCVVLYQMAYQTDWGLATLWVRNTPLEGVHPPYRATELGQGTFFIRLSMNNNKGEAWWGWWRVTALKVREPRGESTFPLPSRGIDHARRRLLTMWVKTLYRQRWLKGQCHEDFAVLGQFCAKIITLRL